MDSKRLADLPLVRWEEDGQGGAAVGHARLMRPTQSTFGNSGRLHSVGDVEGA
jgi:hypothetical protein